MGFAGAWAAFRGIARNEVHRRLGLAETGNRDEFPPGSINGIELPSGWYIVTVGRASHPIWEESFLSGVSQNCEVIGFFREEHVMASGLSLYKDGKMQWRFLHDGSRGNHDIEIEGDLPSVFADIQSKAFREQEEAGGESATVDYVIDIADALGMSICGYHYDHSEPYGNSQYIELIVAETKQPKPLKASTVGRLLESLGFGRKTS